MAACHLQRADRFPATSLDEIYALLHGPVDQGILITSLRPPMTAVDGLTHLIGALRKVLEITQRALDVSPRPAGTLEGDRWT